MKRYFLTAAAIAIGSSIMGAPSALAQLTQPDALPQVTANDGGTVNVPFATVAAGVLPSCVAVPTPGILVPESAEPDNKKLTSEGGISGTILLTCTVGTTLASGTPEKTAGPSDFPNTNTASSLDQSTFSAGINTVTVDMEATTSGDVIEAGVYSFNVPVTVTYN